MKSKLLFLPDVLLLLFICLSCERNEFRHSELNSNGEKTVLSVENKSIASDQVVEEKSWEKIQDTYLKHLAVFKARVLKD